MNLEKAFNDAWYGKALWPYLFYPLKPLVAHIVKRKRQQYLKNKPAIKRFNVPIILVGNITVGGTGKSPMVIALVEYLKSVGYHPGIVSRGYGVNADLPLRVMPHSSAAECGDEPVMLAKKTQSPVVICRNRVKAVELLLAEGSVDVVISDDGMQHYALERDIEILMLDAKRQLGNQQLLPIGPLREPIDRLTSVDFVASLVSQGEPFPSLRHTTLSIHEKAFAMPLGVAGIYNVITGEKKAISFLKQIKHWHVMAGIGNPDRFLYTLKQHGLVDYDSHWFNDHYNYQLSDLPDNKHVIMTEKDAVKCQNLGITHSNLWCLSIAVDLPDRFKTNLSNKLTEVRQALVDTGEHN